MSNQSRLISSILLNKIFYRIIITPPYHCKTFWVTLTIFWLAQLHSFCVCDTNFKECLQFEQSVVQKLSSPFRRLIAFLVRLMFL